MRRKDRIAELSDTLGKLSPPILVVIGVTLAGFFFWRSKPTNISEFSSLADIILKLMAIAIAGLVLPRLAGFKFGGAEFSMKDEGAEIGGAINELSRRLSAIEARCMPQSRPDESAARTEVPNSEPALGPIRTRQDIQKGRFGGNAKVGNYEVSARFPTASRSSMVVKVVLEVRKLDRAKFEKPVRFYLHDSFGESPVDVEPDGDKATFELLAWGGFTVGVWPMETTDTLLELDLAELAYAPDVIKQL